MDLTDAPALAGVHHLKLPVSDLARSLRWYRSRLGYQVTMEFVEQGKLMGYVLEHPNGGPPLGLRLDPGRARAAAGFDYFAIGVPGKTAIDELAARLTALGEDHDGVHLASIGWILPMLHDPDGHEVRFYTLEQHTDPRAPGITTIHDPLENSERRERERRRHITRPAGRARLALPHRWSAAGMTPTCLAVRPSYLPANAHPAATPAGLALHRIGLAWPLRRTRAAQLTKRNNPRRGKARRCRRGGERRPSAEAVEDFP